jgi:hypothetical protein
MLHPVLEIEFEPERSEFVCWIFLSDGIVMAMQYRINQGWG